MYMNSAVLHLGENAAPVVVFANLTQASLEQRHLPVRPHHFLSHAALHAYCSLLCITARKARRSKTTSYFFSNLYRKIFGTSRTIISNVALLRFHHSAQHFPPLVSVCLLPRQASGFPEDSCITPRTSMRAFSFSDTGRHLILFHELVLLSSNL